MLSSAAAPPPHVSAAQTLHRCLLDEVLGQRFSRSLSTSSRVHLQNRVLEKQKIFQADNNVPVHLKGGQGDLILYRITMGIAIVGCCLGIFTIGKASLPKKSP
ncbi:cytochrome c oxidase subunit 7A1, mitochondrial-like isoform X3 [Aquarana catesbeiana]|uniref:cytochrome c oxidase subunit 7A1, mitochondrial-like isoform X3 n=1 Tax=Aquarana catesbeiana TaxID=8400 RepID=UPI003CC9856E